MSKKHQTTLITFGISGFIGDDDPDSFTKLQNSFLAKENAVQINWTGKNFFITSLQSADDIDLSPGKYSFDIPRVKKFQGVVYGQHHWNKDLLQNDESDKSIPERLSKNIINKFIDNKNNALRSINGANIVILYNDTNGEIFIARDDLGIIPIYVFKCDSRIYFSSDLRAFEFLKHKKKLIIDKQVIAEFLHYLYCPPPKTIYEDVESVLSGHYLYFGNDSSYQVKYTESRFSFGKKKQVEIENQEEINYYINKFEVKLKTSLSESLPKKGRVCVLLSGGKDSSVLIIALSQIFPKERILALTIGFNDKNIDESKDAKILCDFLDIPHKIYKAEDDELFDGIKEFSELLDQPFGDPASLPLYLGLKYLPNDIKVIFDGAGTDYYFGWVKRSFWKNYHLRKSIEVLIPKLIWRSLLKLLEYGPKKLSNIAVNWQTPIEDNFNNWLGFSGAHINELFKENIDFSNNHLNNFLKDNDNKHWVELLTNVYGTIWEPNSSFKKTTYIANQLGCSVVYPFSDLRICSFVKSLNSNLKFKKFDNKILIRKYLEKYAPKEIFNKPKGAFIFNRLDLIRHNDYQWIGYIKKENNFKILEQWSDEYISKLYKEFKLEDPNINLNGLYAIALLATWKIQKDKQ